MKKKILVVEDNTSSRILLRKILTKNGYNVIETSNGEEAYDEISKNNFDAILTDWMMPKLDGLELIAKLRKKRNPPPILITTALVSEEAKVKAMDTGADDFIVKPIDKELLLQSVSRAIAQNKSKVSFKKPAIEGKVSAQFDFPGIAITASTGGPLTLVKFFEFFTPTKKPAIFIVLHAPDWMLRTFVGRLQKSTSMKVNLAQDSMCFNAGEIYLAPGDFHLIVKSSQMLELVDSPPENYVKPSADPLFRSVSSCFGTNGIGVVLTGMGHDGSLGSGYISAAGGYVYAQSPDDALISSMPKTIVDLKIADETGTIEELAKSLAKRLKSMK